jgi:hypothetical protein
MQPIDDDYQDDPGSVPSSMLVVEQPEAYEYNKVLFGLTI